MARRRAILAVTCCLISCAAPEPPVERGRYLVEAVMACDNCHTPRGPNGLDMTRRFSGGSEIWDTPAFRVQGSNITPDHETGIGGWSRNDLKRLLTRGIRPDGTRVAPQMPYGFYAILTPADLDAVVSYVRTIKPVRNVVPPPLYRRASYAVPVPGAAAASRNTLPGDPVSRGFYIGTLAYCMACHARRPDGVQDFRNWWGRGGFVMKGTFGAVQVRNISSSRRAGIGSLTDAQLKRVLIEGVGHDGRRLSLPMARQDIYRKMTPGDLKSLMAWTRNLPPVE